MTLCSFPPALFRGCGVTQRPTLATTVKIFAATGRSAGTVREIDRSKQPITRFKAMKMETKAMSTNPHSVVHVREIYEEVEKVPQEVRSKGEPGVAKGMVRDS